VSAFGGKMSTDGHLGSGEAFRNHFDDRGWCVDSGVVCLADMETTASCSHRMRCSRAGRVPDVPWAGATAFPSGAIARRLLPNSRLCEMNALLARQFIRRQCHATFMVDQVAVQNRNVTGIETLIWGNDYSHPEGTWPQSATKATPPFAGVPDEQVDAIVGGNAAKVFGFDRAQL
jgi:Amidohydrolase